MTIHFTHSVIPDPYQTTTVGLLAVAADLVAMNHTPICAIHEAAEVIDWSTQYRHGCMRTYGPTYAEETRNNVVAEAEALACRIASSRHPNIETPETWAEWQAELDEPWPILIDAASHANVETFVIPRPTFGRWTLDEPHQD